MMNPSESLEVSGNILCSDSITCNDIICNNTITTNKIIVHEIIVNKSRPEIKNRIIGTIKILNGAPTLSFSTPTINGLKRHEQSGIYINKLGVGIYSLLIDSKSGLKDTIDFFTFSGS
jgi:hypothetical protein